MSSVRMCDICGTVFSERVEGWSTYEGTVMRKNTMTGKMERVSDEMDACPEDTERRMGIQQRPELATTVSPHYEPDPPRA